VQKVDRLVSKVDRHLTNKDLVASLELKNKSNVKLVQRQEREVSLEGENTTPRDSRMPSDHMMTALQVFECSAREPKP